MTAAIFIDSVILAYLITRSLTGGYDIMMWLRTPWRTSKVISSTNKQVHAHSFYPCSGGNNNFYFTCQNTALHSLSTTSHEVKPDVFTVAVSQDMTWRCSLIDFVILAFLITRSLTGGYDIMMWLRTPWRTSTINSSTDKQAQAHSFYPFSDGSNIFYCTCQNTALHSLSTTRHEVKSDVFTVAVDQDMTWLCGLLGLHQRFGATYGLCLHGPAKMVLLLKIPQHDSRATYPGFMSEGLFIYGNKYSGSINDGNFFNIWATNRCFVKLLHGFMSSFRCASCHYYYYNCYFYGGFF
jgi:hypothetical protein